MFRNLMFGALLATITASTAPAARSQDSLWLHIRVDSKKEKAEVVRINLPFHLIETVLPAIHTDRDDGGRIHVVNGHELNEADLRATLQAIKDSPDGDYVTVDSPVKKVRVTKKDDHVFIHIHHDTDPPEDIDVRIPAKVAAALLSADTDHLDLLAAIHELGKEGKSDLVSVDATDATVKIWVDDHGDDQDGPGDGKSDAEPGNLDRPDLAGTSIF